jgi:hypothetical protein
MPHFYDFRTALPLCFLLLWAFFASQKVTFAQSEQARSYIPPQEIFSVTFAPVALIDVYAGSSYRIGIRIRPTQDFLLSADYGTYFEKFSERFTFWEELEGQNFRCQPMVYPFEDKRYSLGIEYHYKEQHFCYHDSIPDEPRFKAQVDKRIQSLHLIGAFDHFVSSRFFFNFQLGLGIRHQDTVNSHHYSLTDSVEWWDSMSAITIESANRYVPSFSGAFRLGFVLLKSAKQD